MQAIRVMLMSTNEREDVPRGMGAISHGEGTYENADYDYDPYDDDMYEGQEIPENIQFICDNLDIKAVVFACVMDFCSLTNIRTILMNEGLVVWIDVEGIPYHVWTQQTFDKIAGKLGTLIYTVDANEVEGKDDNAMVFDSESNEGMVNSENEEDERIDDFLNNEEPLSNASVVEDAWNSHVVGDSNAMVSLKNKLKFTKHKIKSWNKTKVDERNINKKEWVDKLSAIDKRIDMGQGYERDVEDRWDENTKYFHGIINKKRHHNAVYGILIDGDWVDDPILTYQVRILEEDITRDEVIKVVWECGSEKALGPNGFTFEFFKKFWNLVGDDVFIFFSEFFISGKFPKGCNSSFITLIPRVVDAKLDRPPILAPGRYPQWHLRFLRYVDTKPNCEALRKCILSGPYKPTTVLVQAVEATDDSSAVPEHTTVETPTNMSLENKALFLEEKEAIHLILTKIGDDIYSTIDACQTTQEMWEAIERLQQGESLNIQDVKTNLFWEFRKVTSNDGESIESYYTRFYKLMNEMIRNNLTVTTMQVNVQFLQQLLPEWLRNANPLALVATAQASQDPYYQASRSHRSQEPSSKPSIPTRSHSSTRHKGKKIAKPITPPSETASEEDSDPEQAQRDKDMQKNLALIAKYFKKIYKPTNNNLRTSSNSKNKNVDTPLRFKNNSQSRQFGNQRTVNVAGAREKVKSPVVQQFEIQCFNCREFRHFAKECIKPKRVKDFAYLKEKMLLCKQAEQGVPLQAKQYDWLEDTDEEVDEQELEAHYSYMAKIQEVPTADSGTEAEPVEQTKQTEFEKYKAFNDRTVDYGKLEYKLNEALGQLAHKDTVIREGLKTKAYELSVVKEKHDELMKQSLLTKSHYEGLVKQKTKAQSEILCLYAFPYDQNTHANRIIPDGEETLALERESRSKLNKDSVCPYDYTKLNSLYEIFKPPTEEYETQLAHANEIRRKMWQKSFVKSKPNIYKNVGFLPVSKSISKSRQAYNVMTNNINHFKQIIDDAWTKHSKDLFRAPTTQDMKILIQTCLMPLAIKTQSDSLKFVHELKQEMHADLKYVESLEKGIDELESDKAEFSDTYDVILQECVSKDVMCSYLISLSDLDALDELQCKNDIDWNEKASNVFRKEREQNIKIQDLKAQLQDKNISISELKKLIEKGKGKSMDTKFDKPSVVRQPNAQRISKPSVLGKPTPFSNSLDRIYFQKIKSVPKASVSEGLLKPVTAQTVPQAAKKAVSNTNVLKPGMYRIDNRTAHTRAPQLPQNVRNANPRAVEIAAVGISIAIFNQVSKVAISPFVSITTSFVVEEETIGRINNKAVKVHITEKASMNKEKTKELTQDDVKLENLENSSTLNKEKKRLGTRK
nr:RNA-directed DNA polymerase, eukaryota, reverse transcriptase zinc-binding domain protein [Tanacetum cinerariifolium]